MRKPLLRFGLVGCGAMGTVIARYLLDRWGKEARWVGLCDLSREAAQILGKKLKHRIPIVGVSRLVQSADWIVEAASIGAVEPVLRMCVNQRKNLLVMSTGGLMQCPSLLKEASRAGITILVPSGAVAGLDAVKAARLGRIEEAMITTRKPPRALAGAPYLRENGIDVLNIKEETVIFDGNAQRAMKGFPANINVAASLSLACGLGPEKTRVKIIADPAATRNSHQIVVRGSSGVISSTVENVPSAHNPKTSDIAVMSACAAIDEIFTPVRIGT